MKTHAFLIAASALAFSLAPVSARAETTSTTTIVKQTDLPGVKKFDIESFDDNKDGIITITEAGDHLFRLFDLDSNGVLDNVEFPRKTVITLIPLRAETYSFRDRDDDGRPESGSYSYSTFIEKSGLYMFDRNKDGLSPSDFVKATFLEMDKNNSHVVEPDEWRSAYVESHLPEAAKQYRYNN